MRIVNPKVNYLSTPFIDRTPSISWQLKSDVRGEKQTAYRITVVESDSGAQAYDTGWVDSSDCTGIMLDLKMRPLTPYSYTIETKDSTGEIACCTSSFFSGKCGQEFAAKWITGIIARRRTIVHGAVYLRREFTAPQKKLRRAILVICGLGYFEPSLNGQQIGDEFFYTPYTAYDQNVQYRMFDVTDMLNAGDNVIGVKLGNGYYNYIGMDNWNTHMAPWRDSPKLLCELHMVDEDGNDTMVLTDREWRCSYGPITFNGIRHGENYDARLEMPGWDKPGFDASAWQDTFYVRLPGGIMRVMEMEPIRVLKKLRPVNKWQTENGWMFDIGVAQSGVSNITYHGKKNDLIEVRYSERIFDNGELDQQAGFVKDFQFQTDTYIKATDEPETWHATFTFHGFQFLEVSGTDWEPQMEDIEVWTIGNDLPMRGLFRSSDENLNQVQQLCINSLRACLFSVLNCDTSREKLCWTGDTGLSTEPLLLNFGAEAFFAKLSEDIRDAQKPSGLLPCIIPTPGWGFTFANGADWSQPMYCIPQHMYRQSGDTRALKDNYEALKRFIHYLNGMANDGICACGLGDWCAPFDGAPISVNMSSFKCPMPITDTAHYYAAVRAAQESASLLGYAEDEKYFSELGDDIRAAFRREFYDKENAVLTLPKSMRLPANATRHPVRTGDCQTATAVMIAFGFADEDEIPALTQTLQRQIMRDNDHLDVGVLGMPALMESLGMTGNAQLAADLITRPTYPSMVNWIKMGATSLWEIWNGGGSRNHNMYSSVSAFFFRHVAGIRPIEPGYRRIAYVPMLSGHTKGASATLNVPRGRVSIYWDKYKGGLNVAITVPVSCEGELTLPAEWNCTDVLSELKESDTLVTENPLIKSRVEGDNLILTVPSGDWQFYL